MKTMVRAVRSRRSSLVLVAILVAGVAIDTAARRGVEMQGGRDPFAFLSPPVVLDRSAREGLERGEAVARILESDGAQLAIVAAAPLDAPPEALVEWTRAIAALKRSRFVLAIGRFSDPPQMSDLAELSLDAEDLDALRACTPGNCDLKLTREEIARLRQAIERGGSRWRAAVQEEFRRVVLARLGRYREGGLAAIPPIVDREPPVQLHETFEELLDASPYLTAFPRVMTWLRRNGSAPDDGIESFFYWSKERFGAGRPVILVVHVGISRPSGSDAPRVLVTGTQILATHYMNGALSLTGVTGAAPQRYLFYLNRSQVDLLSGVLGGIRRAIIERRLRRDTPEILDGLRERIESGRPPGAHER